MGKKFYENLNAALVLLDRALEEIENGFVACERCGDQEETKNLDFVDDIKAAKSQLVLHLGREIQPSSQASTNNISQSKEKQFKEIMKKSGLIPQTTRT